MSEEHYKFSVEHYIFDPADLIQLYNLIQEAINIVPILLKKVNAKYQKKFIDEMNEIAESVIDEFYRYPVKRPQNRHGDMYNTYKVIANDEVEDWYVDYGDQYMQYSHHQSNEFVYTNSFIYGYHGGSFGTEDARGVSVDIPYYRGPGPQFIYWTYPAAKSSSPKDEIENHVVEVREKFYQMAQDEFDKIMEREYLNKMYSLISKLKASRR